jgi:alkyl hydroperoxide reductase subunit AhpF
MGFNVSMLPGRVLSQTELAALHTKIKSGAMTSTQEQFNLRKTLLINVVANHPASIPALPFDLRNGNAQNFVLGSMQIRTYNIEEYAATTAKLAPKATAGLRENYDVVDWNNPNYLYNPIFMAILVEAEAIFLKELHAEK